MVQFGIEPGTPSHPASGPAAERQYVRQQRMPRGYLLTINILIVFLVSSCAAQRQLYPGEARYPSAIAIIRIDPKAERTRVLQIGEKRVSGKIWYILPGEYRVVVQAKRRVPIGNRIAQTDSYEFYFKSVCVSTLMAQPGGRYIVTSKGSLSSKRDGRGHTIEFEKSVAAWVADEASPWEPVSHTKCEMAVE